MNLICIYLVCVNFSDYILNTDFDIISNLMISYLQSIVNKIHVNTDAFQQQFSDLFISQYSYPCMANMFCWIECSSAVYIKLNNQQCSPFLRLVAPASKLDSKVVKQGPEVGCCLRSSLSYPMIIVLPQHHSFSCFTSKTLGLRDERRPKNTRNVKGYQTGKMGLRDGDSAKVLGEPNQPASQLLALSMCYACYSAHYMKQV